jgi:hypothetical protein
VGVSNSIGQCKEFLAANIGNGRLLMWWWDPSIHQSDGLRLITDGAEVVIGLHRDGNEIIRVVEFGFFLMITRIKDSHGLTGVDFTEMFWPSMIHDREFQERRAQFEHNVQTVMIGGMHHQHDGSSLRLAWDPRIAAIDSPTTDTDGMVSLRSPEYSWGAYVWLLRGAVFWGVDQALTIYDCLVHQG